MTAVAEKQEHQLIQRITKDGKDFDLNLMLNATYIESFSVGTPIIIFNFNDRYGYIRESLNLKKGDEIEVSIADPYHSDTAFDERFIVLSTPMRNDFVLKINAIQSDIYRLYSLEKKARIFNKKSGIDVIKKLLGRDSVKFTGDGVPVVEDYHLLPSMRPISLVNQIAKERGRIATYRRGEFVFSSLESMKEEKPSLMYHYNDTRENMRIESFKALSDEHIIKDKMDRVYSGFDMNDGYVKSKSVSDSPVEHTGLSSIATLDKMHLMPIPVVDTIMQGNLSLMPSMNIGLVWNKNSHDEPLDESLPDTAIISRVSHYYSANTYQCRTLFVA